MISKPFHSHTETTDDIPKEALLIPIILEGKTALSPFRLSALLGRIKKTSSSLATLKTCFVYFIEKDGEWQGDNFNRALTLLDAADQFKGLEEGSFFVTPRKGTLSPWASKATDIFHNCGITEVSRVERGILYTLLDSGSKPLDRKMLIPLLHFFYDRMTEGAYQDVSDLFIHKDPAPLEEVDILKGGKKALEEANKTKGLALSAQEIDYLYEVYTQMKRNPRDVELMMFGQVNSEHCRHKIFNAEWIIDGEKKDISLFDMIKNTHKLHPDYTLSAYKDNAAVIEGFKEPFFFSDPLNHVYGYKEDQVDILCKVETHNHPTAIAPFPGAATGVGGEIRDEAATGIGGKTKAGLAAFMVSNLKIPDGIRAWEKDYAEFPAHLATPLEIMLEGPIGGAHFGNEFGRPQLTGIFRTFEARLGEGYYGYHKPIMAAGGMGTILRDNCQKKDIQKGDYIIQLGGPALRIGLGGGAASSMDSGSNAAHLDYDSVQRDNAEIQRRCQEVINACFTLKENNPILSIHDIGAGGLSNGCPELVSETGALFKLRSIHNEEKSMSPLEIWCNEAQERYVLAVGRQNLSRFMDLCKRERCPAALIGEATGDGMLRLYDDHFKNYPIDIDLNVILGKPPRMLRNVSSKTKKLPSFSTEGITLEEAVKRVLSHPTVADKTFLITIADRSITGLVARDQMVGPWQTPVSDVGVTVNGYRTERGEAFAMGERTPIALVSGPASGRMAVGEAITNIAAASIRDMGKIKLSANWMCACGEEGEDASLFETVKTVGMELCPKLGISIPVGKDSLSMRTLWKTSENRQEKITSPLSLLVTAFAPVEKASLTQTPDLKKAGSRLICIDLGEGRYRMGGSILSQVYNQFGENVPDLNDPSLLKNFFNAIQEMIARRLILSYHDRSDGGLFVTLAEMAFAGRMGIEMDTTSLCSDRSPLELLFSEELGAVIEVSEDHYFEVQQILGQYHLDPVYHVVARTTDEKEFVLSTRGREIFRSSLQDLHRIWSEMTFRMQTLRDNPECAREEYDRLLEKNDPGIQYHLTYDPSKKFNIGTGLKPKMAILREQGVNGQVEMGAAFDRAGFESIDVHMTDLLSGSFDLKTVKGLAACGGFSYGDVLGAGSGWAKSILMNPKVRNMFELFFNRKDTFTLGVCNGCQMVSQLKGIIPGAEFWPEFRKNRSEQFEARLVNVEILPSPSIFFKGMEGSRIAIPVAHGEGFADFSMTGSMQEIEKKNLLAVRYIDHHGKPAEKYPLNPNGSPGGITGLTSLDGRATILMPHPERVFRALQLSYHPQEWTHEEGPWLRMFENARLFADSF